MSFTIPVVSPAVHWSIIKAIFPRNFLETIEIFNYFQGINFLEHQFFSTFVNFKKLNTREIFPVMFNQYELGIKGTRLSCL